MSNKKCGGMGLAVCMMLLAQGCARNVQPAGGDDTFDLGSSQDVFRGIASNTALGKDELSTYLSDRMYVRGLAPRGKAVEINHADPRQHRFVLARMRLAGKTPANAPQLFKMIEGLKAVHEAKGFTAGTMLALNTSGDGLTSQHELMPTGVTSPTGVVTSGGMASRKDQLNYGYIDSGVWDDLGNQLGNMTFVEIFGDMPYTKTQSVGNQNFAQSANMEGDSLMTEDVVGSTGLQQSYIVSSPQPLGARTLPLAQPPVLRAPIDTIVPPATEVNTIKVCLERAGADCDYFNQHNGFHQLLLPFSGSITTSSANLVFDVPTIQNYAKGISTAPGTIYATLATNGGGCTLTPAAMQAFWAGVNASPAAAPTTLTWDFASDQTKWLNFSSDCTLIDAVAYLTADISNIPVKDTNTNFIQYGDAYFSNQPGYTYPATSVHLTFNPALSITNSCLAEGTKITIGDHGVKPIEDLHIGDSVSNPFAALTVTDVIVGSEHSPMVHIQDDRGHALLLTETHPIYVEGRAMVPAKLLKVGDHVQTDQGLSQLTSVTRESYSGKVFNLKVGNASEMAALQAEQTVMYANGFLVGDAQIQTAYDFAAAAQQHAKRGKLPMSWHDDYMASLKHLDPDVTRSPAP